MSAVSAQAGAVGEVARPPATQGRATEGPAARRAGWAAQRVLSHKATPAGPLELPSLALTIKKQHLGVRNVITHALVRQALAEDDAALDDVALAQGHASGRAIQRHTLGHRLDLRAAVVRGECG